MSQALGVCLAPLATGLSTASVDKSVGKDERESDRVVKMIEFTGIRLSILIQLLEAKDQIIDQSAYCWQQAPS